ncbi:MAG TPA: peptidoglycan recognition family protein [Longimicrobium sp.]|nr:peptidoglycan recognition family protein [Longimicrobium sp.]
MKPLGVVLHVSASTWGDRAEIDLWHRQRGFAEIGYHKVILNGHAKSGSAYDVARDGELQQGRADSKQGAHCKMGGMNSCTFGICSVGEPGKLASGTTPADASLTKKPYLTQRQAQRLVDTVAKLCIQYGWKPKGTFKHPTRGVQIPVITQHSDHDPANKPFCASLHLDAVRDAVERRIAQIKATPGMAAAAGEKAKPVESLAPTGEEYDEEPASDVPPSPKASGPAEG